MLYTCKMQGETCVGYSLRETHAHGLDNANNGHDQTQKLTLDLKEKSRTAAIILRVLDISFNHTKST